MRADNTYASRKSRACLRRRGIRCTIPDKADQARLKLKRLAERGILAEADQGLLTQPRP
ncbi:hypothetical protein [Streptomyces sp. Agncl-13]|uniref:hypothetical protein n=1 Tax=Streptomyces sp. Agncl-13 TaxID=3400628 RepID=UPI003A851A98